MSVLTIFLILSVLILIHEFGHYLAAKLVGIPIAIFSIGMGPKFWGFSKGYTEFRLSILPFGGYVLPDLSNEDEFYDYSILQRIIFSLGGPIANIAAACLFLIALNLSSSQDAFFVVVADSLAQAFNISAQMLAAIPSLFSNAGNLSGVVGIIATGSEYAGVDISKLLSLSILLNLNIAIFNLLPFPPLDGGKILLYMVEFFYRPIRRAHLPASVFGWLLLIGLMGYATVLDIGRLIA